MIAWLTPIGWCTVLLGALLRTPLADLLPVDMWIRLQQFLPGRPPWSEHTYLHVISAPVGSVDPIKVAGAVLIVLGLFLAAGDAECAQCAERSRRSGLVFWKPAMRQQLANAAGLMRRQTFEDVLEKHVRLAACARQV